jgi:hypothetical protein
MKQSDIFVLYGEFLEEQKFCTMKGIVVTHFLSIYDRCVLTVSFHLSVYYFDTTLLHPLYSVLKKIYYICLL